MRMRVRMRMRMTEDDDCTIPKSITIRRGDGMPCPARWAEDFGGPSETHFQLALGSIGR